LKRGTNCYIWINRYVDPCADIPEPDSFDAIVTVNEFAFGTVMTSYAISSKSAVVYPVSPPPGNDVELNVK
jgi:hypothetical protein